MGNSGSTDLSNAAGSSNEDLSRKKKEKDDQDAGSSNEDLSRKKKEKDDQDAGSSNEVLSRKKKEKDDQDALDTAKMVAALGVGVLAGWGLAKLLSFSSSLGLEEELDSTHGHGSREMMEANDGRLIRGRFPACGKLKMNTDGSMKNRKEGFGGRAKLLSSSSSSGLEEELDSTHGHGSHERMEAHDGRLIRWRFPACGKLKMNTDGSVKNRKVGFRGRSGFGGVIRDERGFCIMCFYGTLGDDCLILEAELWALYKGLKIIQGRNLREVEIESDSTGAINLIKNVENDDTKSPSVKEIKTMLSNTGCTLEHTLREGNRVADKLAKLGRDGDSNFASFNTPPKEIWSLLDADVASAGFVRGAR